MLQTTAASCCGSPTSINLSICSWIGDKHSISLHWVASSIIQQVYFICDLKKYNKNVYNITGKFICILKKFIDKINKKKCIRCVFEKSKNKSVNESVNIAQLYTCQCILKYWFWMVSNLITLIHTKIKLKHIAQKKTLQNQVS